MVPKDGGAPHAPPSDRSRRRPSPGRRFAQRDAVARRAHTVRPSATVAALASLATGVGPATHRLVEPGLEFLPRLHTIRPVSRVLARAGIPTDIVTADLGPAALPVAWALASTAAAEVD